MCSCSHRLLTSPAPPTRTSSASIPATAGWVHSPDVLALFCTTCDQLGLRWPRSNARNVSVARRPSVERMDEFIGPKA